ncbi:unnamed protein product [Prorocentrum cordatum]|uniref:Endonuclease/exonuclease/phosphatase domain-containing protein n=1 Tax=Prorocentrum cordatum TaxID=2364126 RepID=A0ABN9TNR5_9DINO|nr:unnamed protein product [Polarella glacialis]
MGSSGGEWILAKKQMQTTSFEAWGEAGRHKSGQDPSEGFCPTCWHLKSGNIVIVSAYLLPQFGFKEANQRTLVRLGAFLRQLRDPCVVLGDWNITPDEWDKTQWLMKLNAERLLVENCTATCNRGSGSAIDYALVSKGTTGHLKLQAVEEVPWKDHIGLKLTIKDGKQRWWRRKLDIAHELPTVPRPKKQADPNSKRQKGIQKAKEERRARLHEHLQAAFDEMYDDLDEDDDTREAVPTTAFNIPVQVWEEASVAVEARGLTPGVKAWPRPAAPPTATTRCKQSKYHFLLMRDPQGQQKIDSQFARWITTLELATLQHHEIDTDEQDAYMGRGRGYATKWVRTSATPARAHLRDPHLEWWHIAVTLLKRYEMLRRTDRITEAASCNGKIVEIMQKAEEMQIHEVFNKDDGEEFRNLKAMLRTPQDIPVEDVIPVIETSERYQGRAVGQALTKSRKAYQSWAIKMWNEAPRHLHNMVKDPRPETVEKIQQGRSVADPDQIMSNRADEWEKHWADPSVTPDQILDGIHMVMGRAWQQPLAPLQLQQLDRLLPAITATKAKGIDNIGPLEVQMHLTPRLLKERQWVSREVQPWRSILAGSPEGVRLAKAFMGPILHRAQLTKQADIGLWTFVDDTVLRSQGTEAKVEKQLIDNGAMLGECLKEAGLTVSPKTTVRASSPKLAIAIAKGLQQRGIPAKAEGNFTDLGVDCNAASMRTRRKGRCLTSTLAMLYGRGDPAKSIPREQLAAWLDQWFAHPELHARIARAWQPSLRRLRLAGESRWRRVRGPISATVATLLDAGWDPVDHDFWVTDEDVGWRFPSPDQPSFAEAAADYVELLLDYERSIDRKLWKQAALHQGELALEFVPSKLSQQCYDDPAFVDEMGYTCANLVWYYCDSVADSFGYTQEGQEALVESCPQTCGTCTDKDGEASRPHSLTLDGGGSDHPGEQTPAVEWTAVEAHQGSRHGGNTC